MSIHAHRVTAKSNTRAVNEYERNGGLFVAWAPVKEAYRAGVVKYLDENFKPLVLNSEAYNDATKPVPVTAPARQDPKK